VISSDVAEFESQRSAGLFEKAVATYGGPLLDGFHVGGAAEFERWTATERERLSREYAHGLEQLARTADIRGNIAGAVDFWRRATENDPLNGRASIGLMRALAAAGDSASAMQHARVHAVLVRQELDAEPDPAVAAYARELRDGVSSKPNVSLELSSAAVADSTPGDTKISEHRVSAQQEVVTPITNPSVTTTAVTRAARRMRMRGRYTGLLMAASLAAIVVALIGQPRFIWGQPPLPKRANRVLFAGFDNRTGDTTYTALGRIADDWVMTSATRVAGFDVVDARLQEKASPSSVRGEPLRGSEILALAAKVGASTIVEGNFSRVRDSLWFEIRITDATSGRLIRSDEPVAASIDDPMNAIRKLGDRVPARLAMATEGPFLESANVSSAPATYEAYVDFLAGTHHMWRGEYEEAIARYKRSASRDSSFTLPVVLAAFVFYEMGRCEQTDSIGQTLAPLRARLARWDRIMLDRQLARCHGNWGEALKLARESLALTPSSDMARGIVVDAALDAQRPHEAIAVHDSVLPNGREHLDPNLDERFLHALHFLGNHDRELNEVRLARRQSPGNIYLMQFEAEGLAAKGLTAEIEKVVDESMTAPPLPQLNPGELMQIAGAELRVHGYGAQAESIEKRSIEWYALLSTDDATMERNVAGRALLLTQAGNLGKAADLYDSLVRSYPDSVGYHGALGVVEARRGNRSSARREDLWLASQRLPYIVGANTLWRARIAARLGNRDLAIAYLRQAISEGQRVWCMHQILDWDLLRRDSEFQAITRPN
jgi:tetratricopeptide (TPR) repeat protein